MRDRRPQDLQCNQERSRLFCKLHDGNIDGLPDSMDRWHDLGNVGNWRLFSVRDHSADFLVDGRSFFGDLFHCSFYRDDSIYRVHVLPTRHHRIDSSCHFGDRHGHRTDPAFRMVGGMDDVHHPVVEHDHDHSPDRVLDHAGKRRTMNQNERKRGIQGWNSRLVL